METAKTFSTAAIGGFKKEEVLSYIDALMEEHNREKTEFEQRIKEQDAQIAALNAIAEEQAQKITVLSEENKTLRTAHDSIKTEYEPYRRAQIRADEIEKKAADASRAAEEKLRDLLADAQARAGQIIAEANDKANQICIAAEKEAQQTIASAQKEEFLLRQNAQEELEAAQKDAHRQVADAAQKGREMLNEAERTVEERIAAADQKLNEAQNILDEAQEKQTEMIKSAQLAAKQERDRYEHGLINLEMQKSELLRTLDEIKLAVQAVSLSREQVGDEHAAEQARKNTADALRKRIAELNQKTRAERRY